MRHALLLASLLLAFVPIAQAQHGGAAPAMPSTTAPAEARQFDFLVGQWEIEVRPKVSGLAAMIHGQPRLLGTWKGWRAFDGFGVEDELRIVDASGNPKSLSHNQRVYAEAEKQWKTSTLDVYRARFTNASARLEAGEMKLSSQGTDAEGKAFLNRTRFFAIGKDAFKMQQDRSYDNGATWDEAVLAIDAKRVAATAPR
jgi:hypothetical protein